MNPLTRSFFPVALLSLLPAFLPSSPACGAIPDAILQMTAFEDQRLSGPDLLGYLKDEDPSIRARAAVAVGRIGLPRDVPALAPLLRDRDTEVRRAAAFGMGEIEDSTAALPLASLLTAGTESDAEVRALAVEGLGKLRAQPEACRAALGDRSPEVVEAALIAAWQIPVEGAFEEVLRLSAHDTIEIRWRAAYCLMRMLGAPASGRTAIAPVAPLPAADRERGGSRLRLLASDGDARVRMQAARGLTTLGDTSSTAALTGLLQDTDWRVRVEALRALAAPEGESSGALRKTVGLDVLEASLQDPHPNVRVTAVEALVRLGPEREALSRLERVLNDPHPRLRQVAYSAYLTRLAAPVADAARPKADTSGTMAGGDEQLPTLPAPRVSAVDAATQGMLKSKDWTMRALAADGAALLPVEKALPIWKALIQDEPRVAKTAIEPLLLHLARTRSGEILPRLQPDLQKLLSTPDPIVRTLTVGALDAIFRDTTRVRSETDWQAFESTLERVRKISSGRDQANDVRLAVVAAASENASRPRMRQLLFECCTDANYLVRREAAAALHKAGGTPPAEPEPVETGRRPEDYRSILEWAEKDHWALIETEGGTIVVRLLSRVAPLTCWNLAGLAGEGFFDHGLWHRVVPDFVLQDGCPRGDGFGGAPREIRCEINRERFLPGTLGMALSGKDTGSSQFFLTHSDQPHLDGRYTVFGRIEQGAWLADQVTQGSPIQAIRVVEEKPSF